MVLAPVDVDAAVAVAVAAAVAEAGALNVAAISQTLHRRKKLFGVINVDESMARKKILRVLTNSNQIWRFFPKLLNSIRCLFLHLGLFLKIHELSNVFLVGMSLLKLLLTYHNHFLI